VKSARYGQWITVVTAPPLTDTFVTAQLIGPMFPPELQYTFWFCTAIRQ
jgi:hypothetical protein